MQSRIRVLGEVKCPKAYRIRDFLQRNGLSYQWTEIDSESSGPGSTNANASDALPYPIMKVGDQTLSCPSLAEIVRAIGWPTSPSEPEYDLAIYGAGPAGLSAAVYGASEGLRTVLVERYAIGGQAGSTSRIENYLGFPEGISGSELASRARDQALRLGAEILLAAECVTGEVGTNTFIGLLDSGKAVTSRAIICATGVEYVRLNLANEDRLLGRGFYYGAGSSEANLCTGHVFVVGGGNSAGQTALNLASRVRKVTMLVRGDSLKHTLSQYLIDHIRHTPNIEVRTQSALTAIDGKDNLEAIRTSNLSTGEETETKTGWVFVCAGGRPQMEWTDSDNLARDSAGYLLTGQDLFRGIQPNQWPLGRDPYPMETSTPGVFAAGDIRSNSVKRCATAVGEGAAAVASVHRYLSSIQDRHVPRSKT